MEPQNKEIKKLNLSDFKLLKGLWPYTKPYAWHLAVSVFLIFFIVGLDLLLPYLTKKAIDGFIIPASETGSVNVFGFAITSFITIAVIFAVVIFFVFIIDFFQSVFMEYTGQKIILNIRTKLFDHLVYLPVSFYDKNSVGRLVSRVTSDIENMNEMFSSILVFIFKDFFLMVAVVVVMFFYDIKFAAATISVVPFVVFSVIYFSKVSRHAFRIMREKIAEINHTFSENIAGIEIIQTSGTKNHTRKKFDGLNEENFDAGMLQIKIFGIFMPLIELFNLVSLTIILLYGGFRVYQGDVTIGVVVAFISYMKMFFRPVRDLSEKFNLLQNAFASSERIVNLF